MSNKCKELINENGGKKMIKELVNENGGKKMILRQGDVLLKEIREVKGTKLISNQKVLAEGEVTNHFHVMKGDCTFYEESTGLVNVEVGSEGGVVVHQEHDLLNVPEGLYAVIIQREFDVIEGIKQVLD